MFVGNFGAMPNTDFLLVLKKRQSNIENLDVHWPSIIRPLVVSGVSWRETENQLIKGKTASNDLVMIQQSRSKIARYGSIQAGVASICVKKGVCIKTDNTAPAEGYPRNHREFIKILGLRVETGLKRFFHSNPQCSGKQLMGIRHSIHYPGRVPGLLRRVF